MFRHELTVPVKRVSFFFFFNRHYNPGWVLACSTVVKPSQQEGFCRVPLPAARQTPNLEENQ
jgi:hypothetical protein